MFCCNSKSRKVFNLISVLIVVLSLCYACTTVDYSTVQNYLFNLVMKSDIRKTLITVSDDDFDGFNASYVFREVKGDKMYSYYNVCIEERHPPISRGWKWAHWGTPNETQKVVIYRGLSGRRNVTFQQRSVAQSVAGSPRSPWNHWELFFTEAPIPSSHRLLPTTAFFVSESIPVNLYHAWNDLFLQLFSVVRDANRLHPGMRNQILYRNPRSHFNLSDPACKFCRRSPYDILLETLHTTNKFILFSELPTNTCYSSAVFGTRYSGSRIRDGIDYVLKELKLYYKPISKNKTVLIIQRQYRRILNIRDLANETEKLGFKNVRVVDLELMTVRQQMAMVVETDILIGVHGAGLQWAIFMRPGTTVVEISWPTKYWGSGYFFLVNYSIKFVKLETKEVFVNWNEYEKNWRKVNSTEERKRMLTSKPAGRDDNIWKYADVTVNVKNFRNILKKLL